MLKIIIIINITNAIWGNLGYKLISIYFFMPHSWLVLSRSLVSHYGRLDKIILRFTKSPIIKKKSFSAFFIRFNIILIFLWVHGLILLFSSICFHLPPVPVLQFPPCNYQYQQVNTLQLSVSAFREPPDFLSWYWPHLHGTLALVLPLSPLSYLGWGNNVKYSFPFVRRTMLYEAHPLQDGLWGRGSVRALSQRMGQKRTLLYYLHPPAFWKDEDSHFIVF